MGSGTGTGGASTLGVNQNAAQWNGASVSGVPPASEHHAKTMHSSSVHSGTAESVSGSVGAGSMASGTAPSTSGSSSGPHASSSSISLDPSILPMLYRVEISVKYQVDEITRLIGAAAEELSQYVRKLLDGYEFKVRDQVFRLGHQWGYAAELTMQNVYNFIGEDFENGFPNEIADCVKGPANDLAVEFDSVMHQIFQHVLDTIPFGNDFADWIKFKRKYQHITRDTERLRHLYIRQEMLKHHKHFIKPRFVRWVLCVLLGFAAFALASSIYFYFHILHGVSLYTVFIFLLKRYGYFLMIILSVLHGWIIFEMRQDSKKNASHSKKESTNGAMSRLNSSPSIDQSMDEDSTSNRPPHTTLSSASMDPLSTYYNNNRSHRHAKSGSLLSRRSSTASSGCVDHPLFVSLAPASVRGDSSLGKRSQSSPVPSLTESMSSEHSRGVFNILGGITAPRTAKNPLDKQKRSHPQFLFAIIGATQFLIGAFCIADIDSLLPKDSSYHYIYQYLVPLLTMICISLVTFIFCSLRVANFLLRGIQIVTAFYEFTAFPSLRGKWRLRRQRDYRMELESWANGMDYIADDDLHRDSLLSDVDELAREEVLPDVSHVRGHAFGDEVMETRSEESESSRRRQNDSGRPSFRESPGHPRLRKHSSTLGIAERSSPEKPSHLVVHKSHLKNSRGSPQSTMTAFEVPLSSVNSTPLLTISTASTASDDPYLESAQSTRLRPKDFSSESSLSIFRRPSPLVQKRGGGRGILRQDSFSGDDDESESSFMSLAD